MKLSTLNKKETLTAILFFAIVATLLIGMQLAGAKFN